MKGHHNATRCNRDERYFFDSTLKAALLQKLCAWHNSISIHSARVLNAVFYALIYQKSVLPTIKNLLDGLWRQQAPFGDFALIEEY